MKDEELGHIFITTSWFGM